MPHHRTTIRNALVTAFAGVSFTVYAERQDRFADGLRPAGILSLTSVVEDSTRRSMGWSVEHAQTVVVELHAHASTGLEVAEALDGMELEIETALADSTLGGVVELIEPGGSEVEYSREQTSVVGVRKLTYIASWRAPFGQPDNPEAS